MNQTSLFAQTPASRITDPDTSAESEDAINASGQRATQQRVVLRLVRKYPDRTSRELAALGNVDRYMVGRRLSELEPVYVRRGEKRRCAVNQGNAVTWSAVTIERNGTG